MFKKIKNIDWDEVLLWTVIVLSVVGFFYALSTIGKD